MFLNLGCFQAQTFSDNEHYTATNTTTVDISNFTVTCTFDTFSFLTINHDGARFDNHLNFFRRGFVLQSTPVEAKLFLHSLDFRNSWFVFVEF